MSRHFSSRQVQDALRTRNAPDVIVVHKDRIGSQVPVNLQKKTSDEQRRRISDMRTRTGLVFLGSGDRAGDELRCDCCQRCAEAVLTG